MRKTHVFVFCGFVLAALGAMSHRFEAQAGGAPVAGAPSVDAAARDSISAERIRMHVRLLEHDLLEGRGTGQRGGAIAAEDIDTQIALDRLKPAGEDGGELGTGAP